MNWFKKLFRKKEKEVKQFTQRPAQSYEEYISHMRRLDDQEFYDLYFNHPPIENYLQDSDNSIIQSMEVPENLTTLDNGVYDPFGHGGTFGGGGASSSWDDSSSSSSYDSGYDSGSYDSGSSDNSSSDW